MSERRAATVLFFSLALGGSALLQLPAALVVKGVWAGPLDALGGVAMLGMFAPLIAAFIANRAEGQRARDLVASLRPRVGTLGWAALALAIPGAIYTASAALFLALGGDGVALFYPPENAQRVAALFVVPVVEEIAWRGYALPRMIEARGPLRASLVLGALWALWHAPMFMIADAPWVAFAIGVPFFVAGSVVFGWMFVRSGGSLFCAVALHMGAHLNNSNLALPANAAPIAIHTVGFCIVALALVVFDRSAWRARSA